VSEARAAYEAAIDKSYSEFRERVATAYQVMADQADKAWYDYQVSIESERNQETRNAEDGDDHSADAAGGHGRESSTGSGQPVSGEEHDPEHGARGQGEEVEGAADARRLPDSGHQH